VEAGVDLLVVDAGVFDRGPSGRFLDERRLDLREQPPPFAATPGAALRLFPSDAYSGSSRGRRRTTTTRTPSLRRRRRYIGSAPERLRGVLSSGAGTGRAQSRWPRSQKGSASTPAGVMSTRLAGQALCRTDCWRWTSGLLELAPEPMKLVADGSFGSGVG